MLFVSANPGLLITGARQPKGYDERTGEWDQTGIDVEFRHGGAPSWAADIALENPRFKQLWGGLPDGVDRRLYLGSYDTEKAQQQGGWSDETRVEVEEFLLRSPLFGINFIQLESPSVRQEEPWRGYDTTHHKKIKVIAREMDPDSQRYALEYERATKNRPEVVADLVEIVGDDVVVAA